MNPELKNALEYLEVKVLARRLKQFGPTPVFVNRSLFDQMKTRGFKMTGIEVAQPLPLNDAPRVFPGVSFGKVQVLDLALLELGRDRNRVRRLAPKVRR